MLQFLARSFKGDEQSSPFEFTITEPDGITCTSCIEPPYVVVTAARDDGISFSQQIYEPDDETLKLVADNLIKYARLIPY
jgi:hypothetical protein